MLSAQLCLTVITSHIYPYRPFIHPPPLHSLLFLRVFHPRGGREGRSPPLLPLLSTPRTTTQHPRSSAQPACPPPATQPCLLPTPQRSGPAPSPQRRIPGTSLAPQREAEEGRSRGGSSRTTGGGGGRGEPHTHDADAAVLREAKGSRGSPTKAEPSAPLSAPQAGRGRLCLSPVCRAPTLRVGYSCTFKVIES